jgi:hypothetical protein
MYAEDMLSVTGSPVSYQSSPGTVRQFCGTCGSGLFYRNQSAFPGKVDVQTGTLDDRDALPPTARIQMAEAPHWFEHVAELPGFARFPG